MDIKYTIGKNAENNIEIIKNANKEDLWFHADNISSCHVIAHISELKLNKKELTSVIKKGAILCKENTNKLKNLKKVKINFTKIKNIKITNIIGTVIITDSKSIII